VTGRWANYIGLLGWADGLTTWELGRRGWHKLSHHMLYTDGHCLPAAKACIKLPSFTTCHTTVYDQMWHVWRAAAHQLGLHTAFNMGSLHFGLTAVSCVIGFDLTVRRPAYTIFLSWHVTRTFK